MSKLRGQAPPGEEVWSERGEQRDPGDRSDQPGQAAPERTADPPRRKPATDAASTPNQRKTPR